MALAPVASRVAFLAPETPLSIFAALGHGMDRTQVAGRATSVPLITQFIRVLKHCGQFCFIFVPIADAAKARRRDIQSICQTRFAGQ